MKNHLILITGPKHSGKSSCARALGEISGWEFFDLDECVEQQTGKTPRALFTEGPKIFREAEAEALARLIQPPESIIPKEQTCRILSLGGGIIDNKKAMEMIVRPNVPSYRNIILVYLDVSAETAWQRILDGANATATEVGDGLPPFLRTDNPKETHFALHKRRAEAYKTLATFTVSAENKSPEHIAREIADYLDGL